jgi:hypothetical protein
MTKMTGTVISVRLTENYDLDRFQAFVSSIEQR